MSSLYRSAQLMQRHPPARHGSGFATPSLTPICISKLQMHVGLAALGLLLAATFGPAAPAAPPAFSRTAPSNGAPTQP